LAGLLYVDEDDEIHPNQHDHHLHPPHMRNHHNPNSLSSDFDFDCGKIVKRNVDFVRSWWCWWMMIGGRRRLWLDERNVVVSVKNDQCEEMKDLQSVL